MPPGIMHSGRTFRGIYGAHASQYGGPEDLHHGAVGAHGQGLYEGHVHGLHEVVGGSC